MSKSRYCNYNLCEIKLLKYTILPFSIILTLCFDQFHFQPKYRIFTYSLICLLVSLLNAFSIAMITDKWLFIFHCILCIFSFVCLLIMIGKKNRCAISTLIIATLGMVVSVIIILCLQFKLYGLYHDIILSFHYGLLTLMILFLGGDTLFYTYKVIHNNE
eukprot:425547_1